MTHRSWHGPKLPLPVSCSAVMGAQVLNLRLTMKEGGCHGGGNKDDDARSQKSAMGHEEGLLPSVSGSPREFRFTQRRRLKEEERYKIKRRPTAHRSSRSGSRAGLE